jgi:hypothetical protein
MLACGSGVDGDAAVTAQGHRNSERDQFPRLGIEVSCFLSCSPQDAIAPDGVGTELAEAGRSRRLPIP